LADRIKVLKAGNNIEAAPQRIRQKQATAEEPVTARIRRRTESLPLAPPSSGDSPDVANPAAAPTATSVSVINTKTPFQDRIVAERRQPESPERTA
jgi:hypothetical protein